MVKSREIKPAVRYSESFKMQLVRELEAGGLNFNQMMRKYGIRGYGTLQRWVGRYGNGSIGKIIRVEKPEEINELKRLKERVKRLEAALADAKHRRLLLSVIVKSSNRHRSFPKRSSRPPAILVNERESPRHVPAVTREGFEFDPATCLLPGGLRTCGW